jgi:hypothetical protein
MIQSPVRGKSGKEKAFKLVFLGNGAFEQYENGVEYSVRGKVAAANKTGPRGVRGFG